MGGEQGMMLSDGNPGGVGGEGQKADLRVVVGDILKAQADGEQPSEIARLGRRAMSVKIPDEFSGNDNAMQLIVALGRRSMENQEIDTTDPDSGNVEHSLAELAGMIADEAGWDREELIREAQERGGAEEMSNTGNMGGVPPVATAGPLSAPRAILAAEGNGKAKNPLQKKKKGNPFKVLMGRVQKLLDHGVDERNQVVRTLMRQKGNRWKRETIEKAFTVVKDRNVRDEKTAPHDEVEEKPMQMAAFNMAEYMRRTADWANPNKLRYPMEPDEPKKVDRRPKCPDCGEPMRHDPPIGRLEPVSPSYRCGKCQKSFRKDEVARRKGEVSDMAEGRRVFNMADHLGLRRTAENEKPQKEFHEPMRDSLYSVERPLSSLSMGELISRLQYAVTASNASDTMIGENMVAYRNVDASATQKNATALKAELSKRGYDAIMLKKLFGIPDATKPNLNYQGEKQPEPKKGKQPDPGRDVV